MDSEQLTVSYLTSEPDDLIFIPAKSGLPATYNIRRTQEGFLIDAVQ
jgi:hypothetical protein